MGHTGHTGHENSDVRRVQWVIRAPKGDQELPTEGQFSGQLRTSMFGAMDDETTETRFRSHSK